MNFDRVEVKWFRHQLLAWGKHHHRNFPWRNTKDGYAILVAECMLQKTNAPLVASLYEDVKKNFFSKP